MKIRVLLVGKTAFPYLEEGIGIYSKRLDHYCDFSLEVIPDIRNAGTMDRTRLMQLESEELLKRIKPGDIVVVLDENGKQVNSEGFSLQLNKWMVSGNKNLVFIIGGAFGTDTRLKSRADFKLSVSSMTFSHQMIRLIFLEQLYRAFTIIKNEPYHHR
jgi:23S rRNA (pseudouridine1915-N3)-methyltransferase